MGSYEKHAEARKSYQQRYNAIHRIGRRKVSKRVRESMQIYRQWEFDDGVRKYQNSIIRQVPYEDPQCTPSMTEGEDELWTGLTMELERQQRTGGNWRREWLEELEFEFELHVESCRNSAACANTEEEVHTQRRLVAVFYQFMELLSQGEIILDDAALDFGLITQQRCINMRVFRQKFKF